MFYCNDTKIWMDGAVLYDIGNASTYECIVELQRQFLALRRAGALPLQACLERRGLGSCALPTHRELPFVYNWGVLRTPLFYQIKSLFATALPLLLSPSFLSQNVPHSQTLTEILEALVQIAGGIADVVEKSKQVSSSWPEKDSKLVTGWQSQFETAYRKANTLAATARSMPGNPGCGVSSLPRPP